MTPILSVEDLRVSYRGASKPAVSNISLEVGASECLAIVGESGSGKTTTALSLLRLLGPVAEITAKSISLADHDFLNASNDELRTYRRDLIGTVFQDPSANWNPTRPIGAQVLQPYPKSEHDQRRVELISFMERVGIDRAAQRVDQYPHNLSGGMLQRAMIAGALLGNPKLLVADEPTSALDVTVQADLIQLLKELTIERSLSMLLISHNLLVVSRIASRVIVMYSGNVIEEGATDDILKSPRHPYTINLISSIPSVNKRRKIPLYTAVSKGKATTGCPYASRCPIAIDVCRKEDPALSLVADRKVACHRAADAPQLIEVTS